MKKRIVTLIMCLAFIMGGLSLSAQAAYLIDSGECGENVTWTLDNEYVMTISGEGDMYDYEGPMTEWHIETVIIEDGVTSIGDYAFWGRSGITSVTIPDSVTRIGNYAFGHCEELTEIQIPDSVTYIGDYAFIYCFSLADYNVPENVAYIGESAFTDTKVIDVITERIDVKDVIDAGICGKELVWILDNNYTLYVVGQGDMYDFDGPMNEWHIETAIIEDGVTSIGNYAFWGRSGITSVTIPDSVTSIGEGAFGYCTELTNITIPGSVTYIGEWAFADCSKLDGLYFEGDAPKMSEEIFSNSGATIYYPQGNSTWSDMKYTWHGYYRWIEYDPANRVAETIPEINTPVEDVSVDVNDDYVEEESVESESYNNSGQVVISILRGAMMGIFGVLAFAVVGIVLYKIHDAAKERKNNGDDK